MGIGKNMKRILAEKGITIKTLSETSGIPKNTLYSITKRDSSDVTSSVLTAIAQALDVSPYDLTVDLEHLQSSVKTIEGIQVLFGAGAVSLLENYDSLNDAGKKKANEYVADLTEQPKYKKKPPPGSSGSGSESN